MISRTEKLFLLLVILASGALISADYSIIKILLVLVFIVLLIKREEYIVNNIQLLLFLFITFILWVFQALIYYPNSEVLSETIRTSLLFVVMLLYANCHREKNIERIECIYKILIVFTIVSDIIFVMLCANISLPTFNTSISRDTVFYLQNLVGGNVLRFIWYRNSGIFWEPGLYQVFLNFMLIWALYRKKNKRFLHVIFIVLTILSTGSVMGYITSIVIFTIYAFNNSERIIYKVFFILLGAFAIMLLSPYALGIFYEKLLGESYFIRNSDLTQGLKVFLQKPLLGYGISNRAYENYYLMNYAYSRGNSNGLVIALISFGIIGTSIFAWMFLRATKFIASDNNSQRGISIQLVFWLILSLMNEPIAVAPFIFFLIGMGSFQNRNLI